MKFVRPARLAVFLPYELRSNRHFPILVVEVVFGLSLLSLLLLLQSLLPPAAVYLSETYWSGARSAQETMVERDPLAFQLWTIKKGNENTTIMLSEYQERLVNDCIDALNKYFPDNKNWNFAVIH